MHFSLCDGAIIPRRFDKNGRINVCVCAMYIQRALASMNTWRLHESYIVSLLQFCRCISRWCFNGKSLFTSNFVWSIQWKHTRLIPAPRCFDQFVWLFLPADYMWFCEWRHWQFTGHNVQHKLYFGHFNYLLFSGRRFQFDCFVYFAIQNGKIVG